MRDDRFGLWWIDGANLFFDFFASGDGARMRFECKGILFLAGDAVFTREYLGGLAMFKPQTGSVSPSWSPMRGLKSAGRNDSIAPSFWLSDFARASFANLAAA